MISAPRLRAGAASLALFFFSTLAGLALAEGAIRLFGLGGAQRAALEAPTVERTTLTGEGEEGAGDERAASSAVLHPFRGWAGRPAPRTDTPRPLRIPASRSGEWKRLNHRKNALGFPSAVPDYRSLGRGDFVVGIFGGSVAQHLALYGGDALVRQLEARRPDLVGSIYVLNLTMGGYKQPQQLNLFAEMLLLGVPFDVVVNVDGFNEVALSASDAALGDHPLLPQRPLLAQAYEFNTGSPNRAEILHSAEIFRLEERIEGLRELGSEHLILGSLEFARLALGLRVQQLEARRVELEKGLGEAAATRGEALYDLDDPCLERKFDCWGLIADIWERSSLGMHALARRFGVDYVHALQPNQYVDGTKALSEEELACCYRTERLWSKSVARGYPALVERGEALARRGVDFHDLTRLLEDHPETIYKDACCHFNDRGNQLLGTAVGDLVADAAAAAEPVKRRGPDPATPP